MWTGSCQYLEIGRERTNLGGGCTNYHVNEKTDTAQYDQIDNENRQESRHEACQKFHHRGQCKGQQAGNNQDNHSVRDIAQRHEYNNADSNPGKDSQRDITPSLPPCVYYLFLASSKIG